MIRSLTIALALLIAAAPAAIAACRTECDSAAHAAPLAKDNHDCCNRGDKPAAGSGCESHRAATTGACAGCAADDGLGLAKTFSLPAVELPESPFSLKAPPVDLKPAAMTDTPLPSGQRALLLATVIITT